MRTNEYGLACLLTVVLATLSSPACGQNLRGPVIVADGDSFSVSGIRVRLFGVDAPEYTQKCLDGAAAVPCGEMAKAHLASLIGTSDVVCSGKATDPYGRVVAICRIGNVDLARAMVEDGWAIAYRAFSENYVPSETRARSAKLGLWRWNFQTPEDYRQAVERRASPVLQERPNRPSIARNTARRWERNGQCLIKGNHSRRGEWIYHLPGMPYYNATRAEEYFCTEAEAAAAGYRRARVR